MSFQEKSIVCFDCGATFSFTVEEQEFFATKGYTNEPKPLSYMPSGKKQQQGNIGSSNRGYSQTGPRQMYPVVCAQCGKNTEVPFAPTSGRPVYCRDCYNKVAVKA